MAIRPTPSDQPQLDLLGTADARPAEVHRLFFALLPDAATRARLAQAAQAFKASHPGLRARWVSPARYHATLHFLGDHALLRQDVVDAAMAAATELRMAPFEWVLHEAASFRGRQPPCILRSSSVPEPLQQLWQDLRRALVLAGQGRHVALSFTPHVTIAYSHAVLLDVTPVEPVAWRVERVALVHSVVGQQDYQVLAEWSLQAVA
jgi:RNA 2',3'-cyclic 3'-phosphodiesterase